MVAMFEGNAVMGEEFFKKSIEANPKYANPYLNLGKIRTNQKNFVEAIKFLQQYTDIAPLNVEALFLLTNALVMNGNFTDAIAMAQRVHGMPHERFSIVHVLSGISYERLREFPKAKLEYQMYLKESPHGPMAERARSAIVALTGRTEL